MIKPASHFVCWNTELCYNYQIHVMRKEDSQDTDPVTRLISYGVPEWRITFCTGILPRVATMEELDRQLGEEHTTIDGYQLLMPVFRPIYQNEPEIRKAAMKRLQEIRGISDAVIDGYFLKPGDQPYLAFHLEYEDAIPTGIREHFVEAASTVVLNTIKSYLGLDTTESSAG